MSSLVPRRYASHPFVLGRRNPSTYTGYASGFLLPRASGCSHLGAARVDVENESDRNVQTFGDQAG